MAQGSLRRIWVNLRFGLQRRLIRLIYRQGWDSFVFPRPKSKVLLYHGIDHVGSTQFNYRFISKAEFERHLQYIRKHFALVKFSEFVAGRDSFPRPTLALTFDDGQLNNYLLALPLLRKYQVPATFFVSAGQLPLAFDYHDIASALLPLGTRLQVLGQQYVLNGHRNFRQLAPPYRLLKQELELQGEQGMRETMQALTAALGFDPAEHPDYALYCKPMNEAQVRELAADPLFEVGNHGQWHTFLAYLSVPEALAQVRASDAYFRQLLGTAPRSFAFPGGSYTPALVLQLAALGYPWIALEQYLHPEHAMLPGVVDRLGIYGDMEPSYNLHFIRTRMPSD